MSDASAGPGWMGAAPRRQLVAGLRAEQAPSGAFRSTIVYADHEEEDYNGFATALVLRSLRQLSDTPGLDTIRQHALHFLARCAAPELHGAFGFWPPDERPCWARRVPADSDDTAVISLELYRHGWRTLQETQRTVYEVLVPQLLTDIDSFSPRWIRPLVFPTWHSAAGARRANVVDCCVNANVLALMAACDLKDLPGYHEACRMIDHALAWAAEATCKQRLLRLRTLTPYYPDPAAFLSALKHAVACGGDELKSAVDQLCTLCAQVHRPVSLRGALCSNAYGGPTWHCEALERVERAVVAEGKTLEGFPLLR